MFISTTAVFLAELVKLVTCLGLVWNSEERDVGRYVHRFPIPYYILISQYGISLCKAN